jgi:4-amino-4-deoxy-L-arabinose transferase-like glycosyltransferase
MSRRCTILLAFLLALALRLAPVLLTYDLPIGLDDMFQYDMLARSIVAGNGYRWYAEGDLRLIERYITMERPAEYDPRGIRTSFRAPGYPAFLALIYAIAGVGPHRFFAARLTQAMLGAALAPLSWILARRAGFTERTAQWAAIIIAVFPLLVVYPLALASENLFIPLLALALVLMLRAGERGHARDHVLTGLVLGCATLTRSVVAGFVPLAALWTWRTAKEKRAGFRNGALLVLCFLLVTTPWAIRNTLLHGQLTWIETSLGYNLYVGYHPQSTGTFQYGISLDLLPILDDLERNTRGIEAFWRFVSVAPERVPYLMVRKAGHLWGLDSRALIYFYANGYLGQWSAWLLALTLLLTCSPLILLAPAAAGGLVCGCMEQRKALVVLLVIYYTASHILIMAEPRFHVPLLPLVAVFAAYAFVERPWRWSHPWQRGLSALLAMLLFLNWGYELTRDWSILIALFGPEGHHLNLPY